MGQMRMLLALGVVLVHLPWISGSTGFLGSAYVEAFVCASGFFIAMVLSNPNTKNIKFLASRALRIFPIYYIVLVSVALIRFGFYGSYKKEFNKLSFEERILVITTNITLIGSDWAHLIRLDSEKVIYLDRFLIVPPSWSLGMELGFYIVSIYLINRSTKFLCGLLIIFLLYRLFLEKLLKEYFNVVHERPTTFAMFSVYLIGFILYKEIRHKQKFKHRGSNLVRFAILPVFIVTFVLATNYSLPYLAEVALLVSQVLVASFLVEHNNFENKLSSYSYPLYIVHFPLIEGFWLFSKTSNLVHPNVLPMLSIISCLIAAILLTKITSGIEKRRKKLI